MSRITPEGTTDVHGSRIPWVIEAHSDTDIITEQPINFTCPKEAGTKHNILLGKAGEEAAAAFVANSGLHILARNWECPVGEADIVAIGDDGLHFIEVKTRSSALRGFPEEAINEKKRHKYELLMEYFLRSHRFDGNMPVLFEAISILVMSDDRAIARWHRNMFADE